MIKRKYIRADAVSGDKILLRNAEALRSQNASGDSVELMKLDAAGVLQFMQMPQVSSDPTNAADVARKGYVDAQISSAQSDITSDLSALETALDAEVSRATAAEGALQSEIDAEELARANAVSAEQSAREAADQALDGRVTSLEAFEASSVTKAYVDAADEALDARLDIVEGDSATPGSIAKAYADSVSYTDGQISALVNGAPAVLDTLKELADALGSDENFAATVAGQIGELDGRLDVLEGGAEIAGSVANLIAAEAALRIAGDDSLSSAISAESSARAEEIADEAAAREAADTALAGDIADEVSRATAAEEALDAKIDDEIFNRSEAVSAEQAAREAEDLTFVKLDGSRPMTGQLDMAANSINAASGVFFTFDGSSSDGSIEVSASADYKLKLESSAGNLLLSSASFDVVVDANALNPQVNGVSSLGSMDKEWHKVYTSEIESSALLALTTMSGVSITGGDLQLSLNKITMVGEPVAADDAATKGYVDAEIASSQADLTAELNAIDARLDTVEGDASVAGSIAHAVAAEAALREAADDAEQTAREAAVLAEETARIAADDALDARLDTVEGDASVAGSIAHAVAAEAALREAAISAEESARQTADAGLQSQIDSILSNVDPAALDSLTEIVAAFEAADSTINGAITSLAASASADLAAETAAREAADLNLVPLDGSRAMTGSLDMGNQYIVNVATPTSSFEAANKEYVDLAEAGLQGSIDAEETRAMAAEAALQSEIDAEESARAAAVAAVQAEVDAEELARAAADSTLQSNIDAVDAALDQEIADRISAVSAEQSARISAVSAEEAARIAADSVEETARIAGDASTLVDAKAYTDAQLDTLVVFEQSYESFTLSSNLDTVTVASTIVGTPWVMADGVMARPGIDFTFSGAVITWAGDWHKDSTVSPVASGDVIHVYFMKSTSPFNS